jgi:DNA primase
MIFVAEGEAQVDALAGLGLVATTSPMGAGKWPDEFGDYLAGAGQVVVLPDDDDPGRCHAVDVVRSVSRCVADVRVLELWPRGQTRADIIDWLAALRSEPEHARDRLLQMAETATTGS